jgi:formylglycine-generating enzyme required for sulfatase activity
MADLREKGTRLNLVILDLVILDACRDNPLEQVAGRSVGSARGLAVTEPPEGTFIMFSAGSGESALDHLGAADADPNSVYTRQLLPLLRAQGVSMTEVAEQVRVGVRQVAATVQHKQTPAYYNQVLGLVCLAGGDCAGRVTIPALSAPPHMSEAAQTWAFVKDTTNQSVLEAYLKQFGDTVYGAIARARLDELKKQQVSAARPPTAVKLGLSDVRCLPLNSISVSVADDHRCIVVGRKGDWFKDCPSCPDMVVMPAGRFILGSPADEPERSAGREDQVSVTISKPFAVGRFAVTRGEFAAFVAATGHKTDGDCDWRSPGFLQTDRHPVVCVNWNDAKAYVAWLSSQTGKSYRLLSESEREYVTRAGTTTPLWWGSLLSPAQANYIGTAEPYKGRGSKGESRRATVPVDTFAANPWGLFNVHGNVWEWTEDCWNEKNAGNPADGSAWTAGDCGWRVVRGGSLSMHPRFLRSSNRFRRPPDYRIIDGGFRVARTL